MADACEKYGSSGGHLGWCRCSILDGVFHDGRLPTLMRARQLKNGPGEGGRRPMHVKSMEAMVATLPFALGPNLPVLTAVFGPPAVAEVTVAALSTLHCMALHCIALHRSARSGQLSLGQVIDCLRACGPNTKYRIFSQLQIWPPASAEKKGSRNGHHLTICCIFKKLPLCQSSQEKVFWHMSREIHVLVNLSEYEYLLSVSFGIEKAFRLDVAQPRRIKLMAAD